MLRQKKRSLELIRMLRTAIDQDLEEHGMIVPFGKWVARTAMQNGKKWLVRNPDFKVSINASAL